MRVLVACEFSGTVRDAFRRAGHDAWSNDLEDVDTEGEYANYHLYGDARWFLEPGRWDLLIAHPPCTYLCNSGVRWLDTQRGRRKLMREAAAFFRELLAAPVERIAVENPIPHRHAKLPPYTQTIQPWQFGHGEVKRTCLWLKGLPPLVPTEVVTGREARVHKMPPSAERGRERSRTLPGIAAAMAAQWGNHV